MSAPTTPLKVMLVEDDTAFREALAFVLSNEHELEVVAQAGSLAEAREALDGDLDGRLDVALLDLALSDGDGTELIAELRRSNPSIKVMVLSATIWPRRVEELLLRAEVDAVLDKWKAPTQIAREVRREGGRRVKPPSTRRRDHTMPSWSARSRARWNACYPELRRIILARTPLNNGMKKGQSSI